MTVLPAWAAAAANKARAEGRIARRVGVTRDRNPFTPKQRFERPAWFVGWDAEDREIRDRESDDYPEDPPDECGTLQHDTGGGERILDSTRTR